MSTTPAPAPPPPDTPPPPPRRPRRDRQIYASVESGLMERLAARHAQLAPIASLSAFVARVLAIGLDALDGDSTLVNPAATRIAALVPGWTPEQVLAAATQAGLAEVEALVTRLLGKDPTR